MLKPFKTLTDIGFKNPGGQFLPDEIFSIEKMLTLKGFLILIGSGILVGFGARYAGGCTSGHAITGLSNLEIPSLISVIGFFIGRPYYDMAINSINLLIPKYEKH